MPVISTSVGVEGLSATKGETVLIEDKAEEFAYSCLMVLNNNALGQNLAEAGYRFGREYYDWRTINNRIDGVLTSIPIKNSAVSKLGQ